MNTPFEIDEEIAIAEIHRLYNETPLQIGRLILKLRQAKVHKPGTFLDYCDEHLPIGWREASRLAVHARTSDLCQKVIGVRPANRLISRLLNAVALNPKWLHAVYDQLAQQGLTIAVTKKNSKLQTATGKQVQAAITALVPETDLIALRKMARNDHAADV